MAWPNICCWKGAVHYESHFFVVPIRKMTKDEYLFFTSLRMNQQKGKKTKNHPHFRYFFHKNVECYVADDHVLNEPKQRIFSNFFLCIYFSNWTIFKNVEPERKISMTKSFFLCTNTLDFSLFADLWNIWFYFYF